MDGSQNIPSESSKEFLKMLESTFSSASTPISSIASLLSKFEAMSRENISLKEQIEFLESTSNLCRTQSLVLKKLFPSSSSKNSNNSTKNTAFSSVRPENEPKKALSAFFCFNNEVRLKILEEQKAANGKVDIGAAGKKIGALWVAMDDAVKAKYIQMAEADRARYERECQAKGIPVKSKASKSACSNSSDSD
jgi:hypothetical protein